MSLCLLRELNSSASREPILRNLFLCFLTFQAFAQAEESDSRNTVDLETYEIVTTATRTERLATEVPVRTELLGPELFRASGAPDLAAALEYLPGARVEANCQNCGTARGETAWPRCRLQSTAF